MIRFAILLALFLPSALHAATYALDVTVCAGATDSQSNCASFSVAVPSRTFEPDDDADWCERFAPGKAWDAARGFLRGQQFRVTGLNCRRIA